MANSHEKILATFPQAVVEPIVGVPTYESIAELNVVLNANAASVHCPLGNGQLGYLVLTVSRAVYQEHSATAFVVPVNPGPHPNIPNAATAAQISAATSIHKEQERLWREYRAVDNALKQQLLGAIEDQYVRTLRHNIVGYANVTTLELLTHLYSTYGKITPQDLDENDKAMKTPYNPTALFEVLVAQIESARDLAAAAKAPYADHQLVTTAYNLVFRTQAFPEACRSFRALSAADKTWARFKKDFAAAHQDLRETQATTQDANFQGANAAITSAETTDALANLASATAADRSTVAQLTESNANLVKQLTEITAMVSQLRANAATSSGTGSKKGGRKHKHSSYCWTHGYKVGITHTSATCMNPAPGHQKDATRSNTMGGSTDGAKSNA